MSSSISQRTQITTRSGRSGHTAAMVALALAGASGCGAPRGATSGAASPITSGAAAPGSHKEQIMSEATTHHAQVHGIDFHYTVRGHGAPLVLLHGGVGAGEMFAEIAPQLAVDRQVIAVDLQGHGLTGDDDRPLRLETMADDVAALIGQIGLTRVDVVGYSLGGGVAVRLAIQHRALVGALIAISTAFARDGWYPEVRATMDQMGPEAGRFMSQSPLARLYPQRDWGRLFGKLGDLLRRDYDWSKDVAAIRARVMLVFADADSLRPAHVAAWYGLLGGGQRDAGLDGSARSAAQLAIVPGTTHYSVLGSPLIVPIVRGFLGTTSP